MEKDAFIFIPGISQEFADQSFENMARRIALAFERQAETANFRFSVKITNESFRFSDQRETQYQMATILRENNDEPVPLIDFYELEYHSLLTKDYYPKNLLINAFRLFLVIIINIPRIFWLFFGKEKRAKTLTEKLQGLYAIGILSLLIVYAVILLIAGMDIIIQVFNNFLEFDPPNWLIFLRNSEVIVIFVALVEIVQPNIKEVWIKSAIQYVSIVEYLSLGTNKSVIKGKLTNFIENVAEKSEYKNIHIIAYSFGTIVAIDTIFPIKNMPTQRINSVNTLVTIGCPIDFIRLLWKDYFSNRKGIANIPKRWINIYSSIDILASNFRDDNKYSEAEKKINLTNLRLEQQTKPENNIYSSGIDTNNLSLITWLALIGLRTHTMYWEKNFQSEVNCFDLLILAMYKNSDFLK